MSLDLTSASISKESQAHAPHTLHTPVTLNYLKLPRSTLLSEASVLSLLQMILFHILYQNISYFS